MIDFLIGLLTLLIGSLIILIVILLLTRNNKTNDGILGIKDEELVKKLVEDTFKMYDGDEDCIQWGEIQSGSIKQAKIQEWSD